jgi:hypothetical protein
MKSGESNNLHLEQQLNQLNQQEQHHQHEEVKMNEKYLAMIDLHETLEQQNVNTNKTISTLENNLNQTKDQSRAYFKQINKYKHELAGIRERMLEQEINSAGLLNRKEEQKSKSTLLIYTLSHRVTPRWETQMKHNKDDNDEDEASGGRKISTIEIVETFMEGVQAMHAALMNTNEVEASLKKKYVLALTTEKNRRLSYEQQLDTLETAMKDVIQAREKELQSKEQELKMANAKHQMSASHWALPVVLTSLDAKASPFWLRAP